MQVKANLQAMVTGSILSANEGRFSKSSEKITSGFKLNSSKDGPAGFALSNKMHTMLRALDKATDNTSNGINVVQTAEGAIGEVQNMIQRMKELSVKASNETLTDDDRRAINAEVEQYKTEIARIADKTEYNTKKLLNGDLDYIGYSSSESLRIVTYNDILKTDQDSMFVYQADGKTLDLTKTKADYKLVFDSEGNLDETATKASEGFKTGRFKLDGDRITYKDRDGSELVLDYDPDSVKGQTIALEIKRNGGLTIQSSDTENEDIVVAIPPLDLKSMDIDDLNLSTLDGAKKGMDKIDAALRYVSDIRSRLGAYQNRLEASVTNTGAAQENLYQAYSVIKDVDMAEEMVEYTRLQVLSQAGISMLTQANESPQSALQLLQ